MIAYASNPTFFSASNAMMIDKTVKTQLTVPAIAIPELPAMDIIIGAKSVVPQVGQPDPSTIKPVIIPAFWRFDESLRYLYTNTTSPINADWRTVIEKIKRKSDNSRPTPKVPRKAFKRRVILSNNPTFIKILNAAEPEASKFNSVPKIKNATKKAIMKRFFLVARKTP